MQAEDRIDVRVFERALLDHRLRTTTAVRRTFLRRLEDELHCARERRFHADEYFGRAHQNRDMIVMPAGVHHADRLPAIGAAYRRLEWQIDLLRHRQRIHVRAQCDDRSRLAAAQDANHTMAANFCCHLESERPQMRGNERRRAHFLTRQFRMLMNVPPPRYHLRRHRRDASIDILVHRRQIRRALSTRERNERQRKQTAGEQ